MHTLSIMNGIDHFTIEYPTVASVTFVRIGKYLGWHGHFYKPDFQSPEYGDWITLTDEPLTLEAIKEGCELLGDQAARSLIEARGETGEWELAQFIRQKINQRTWK